jgi:succinate-semialdehyde dehydrogenase / glutarate-semialdehyde dehydrogenase
MALQTKNPATEEILKSFEELSEQELGIKIQKAHNAFLSWKGTTFQERKALMLKLADYLRKESVRLGELATIEMGKTKKAGALEVEKCALVCEYYAHNGEAMLSHELYEGNGRENYVQYDPLGVVLAVMPWNFPYWQVFRFAAPALMAGNVGLLKHASNVPQCGIAIEQAFIDCGFPEGVFQNLLISSGKVEQVIRHKNVMAVTLTGSEKAGSDVARIAGEELKKTVLELGGSDPFIVLADADVETAAKTAVSARMQNNAGQSCIAAKRFIVHKDIADKFTKLFVEEMSKLVVGDPVNENTNVGPLATAQICDDITAQVNESVSQGAVIELGGKRCGEKGYFYMPTILTNVKKGMPVYDEETFGPIAPVIVAASIEEAVSVANDTPYGLGATVFTNDMETAKKMISQIDAGNVFINTQVISDPRAPFGGVKKSGFGRELSYYGIREFVNIKNVNVK